MRSPGHGRSKKRRACVRVMLGLLAGAILVGEPGAALWAQTQPLLPGTLEPGTEAAPGPGNLESEEAAGFSFETSLPAGRVPPRGSNQEPIEVAGIRVRGVTAYPRHVIEVLLRPALSRTVKLADLYLIANGIERRYRADGFPLSFVTVPAQVTGNGVFVIEVIEGYVAELAIEGAPPGLTRHIERLLAPVLQERPVHLATMDRALNLVNDLPGVRAQGTLRRSKVGRGAAGLLVDIDWSPVAASVDATTDGSEYAGPRRAGIMISGHGMWIAGDRFTARYLAADPVSELSSLSLSTDRPAGYFGGRLFATVNLTRSRPGFTIRRFDLRSKTIATTVGWSYPIIRLRERTIRVDFTFSTLDAETTSPFASLRTKDRIRKLTASISLRHANLLGGRTILRAALHQGLPGLGNSPSKDPSASRVDAVQSFTVLRTDASHTRPLFDTGLSASLKMSLQLSAHRLLAAEEFSLGGAPFGRGYDSGELKGDAGIATAAEIYYNFPFSLFSASSYFRIFSFFHAGRIWKYGDREIHASTSKLLSGGGGVLLRIGTWIQARAEYQIPLSFDPGARRSRPSDRLRFFLAFGF